MQELASPSRFDAAVPSWNLSELYAGIEDPRLAADIERSLAWANDLRSRFYNRLDTLDAAALASAMAEVESLFELVAKYSVYAELLHAADSRPASHGALLSRTRLRASEVRQNLLFFELEWLRMAPERAESLLAQPEISRYRHYLQRLLRYRPHVLSEAEERILEEKSNTGVRAFTRLFDEELSLASFVVEHEGEVRRLTESEVLALMYEPNRGLRQAAAEALTRGLEQQSRRLTYIFNVVVQDHASDDKLRGYTDPMESRHLANEVDASIVDALLLTCEAHYPLAQRYYRLKQRLLGLEPLYDYDRYAPVGEPLPPVDWSFAQRTVLEAFAEFSAEMAEIAERFFVGRWIDAQVRPGKQGGAFSSSCVPSVHPYVLLNFTGKLNDVMTLAHELGHGVHQYLARERGYLQMDAPLTMAETASVFGEMLVFQSLKGHLESPRQRLALLCQKIEETIATVFRQVCLTRFEQHLHSAWRSQGELSPDEISRMWQEENVRLYGESVQLTDGYRWWWSYIPHFLHTPFYCYAYAFGELLVLSLFELYRAMGPEEFVPRYLQLLRQGGAASPAELLAPFGMRLEDPEFWQRGMRPLERLLGEAEALAAEAMAGSKEQPCSPTRV